MTVCPSRQIKRGAQTSVCQVHFLIAATTDNPSPMTMIVTVASAWLEMWWLLLMHFHCWLLWESSGVTVEGSSAIHDSSHAGTQFDCKTALHPQPKKSLLCASSIFKSLVKPQTPDVGCSIDNISNTGQIKHHQTPATLGRKSIITLSKGLPRNSAC